MDTDKREPVFIRVNPCPSVVKKNLRVLRRFREILIEYNSALPRGANTYRTGVWHDHERTSALETNRPQLDPTGPDCGRAGFLFDYYCAASSILVRVNSNLPSTSLTVPVAVTFLVSLQSLPWNSLLTSLATKK